MTDAVTIPRSRLEALERVAEAARQFLADVCGCHHNLCRVRANSLKATLTGLDAARGEERRDVLEKDIRKRLVEIGRGEEPTLDVDTHVDQVHDAIAALDRQAAVDAERAPTIAVSNATGEEPKP